MRRILTATGLYLAGLVTLPLLLWDFDSLQTRTIRLDGAARVVPAVHDVQPIAVIRVVSPSLRNYENEDAKPADPVVVESPAFDVAQVDAKPAEPFESAVPEPASRPNSGLFLAPNEKTADEGFGSEEPGPEPAFRPRRHFEGDVPPGIPVPSAIVLPVGSDTLAHDAALDEAGLAKVKELRETLKKLIEEKSAKMSAEALEREIEMHRQHLADMNALEELLRLEQSLKELGDKFPNSDSGRKAQELLKALEHLRTPGGALHPVRRALPGAQPIQPKQTSLDSFLPESNPDHYKDQPIRSKQI